MSALGRGRDPALPAWVAAVAGALFFAVAAYANRAAALQSYLIVWWFLLGLPLGSMAILMAHNLTGGGWGELARPVLERTAALLPLTLLLAAPLFLGIHELYAWSRAADVSADPLLRAKSWYLSLDFFVVRNALYFVVWLVLALWLRRMSWARGPDAPVAQRERLRAISAIGLLVYGASVTFAAIDWIMSLMPHWYSTTFGLLAGIGQATSAFAFAIAVTAFRERDTVEPPRANLPSTGETDPREPRDLPGLFQDLGNLLLMFVMTWAYLAFTQYLIIWAEDLPNEIAWYLPRVKTSWHDVALFLVVFHFALPFLVLLSRRAKRAPRALGLLAATLLGAHLVDAYWLVAPTFRPDGVALAWSDAPAVASLCGIWLAVFLRTAPTPAGAALEPASRPEAGHG